MKYIPKITPLSTYSTAKYLSELIKLCELHQLNYKVLGSTSYEKVGITYPIYRIDINPEATMRFVITAGIHGDEIAGPLTFIKLFHKHKSYFNPKIHYQIYPLINPIGFDIRKRENGYNEDLNNLDKNVTHNPKYPESAIFHDDINGLKVDAFVSLHEDLDQEGYYAYTFQHEKSNTLYKLIAQNAAKFCPVIRNTSIYGDRVNTDGQCKNIHDGSFEDYLFSKGNTNIALATETPGKISISKRIAINLLTIKTISNYLIQNIENTEGINHSKIS